MASRADHTPASSPSPELPPVIEIMCDELTAEALGCYGSTVCQTPHLDELAQDSVRFDRAYVQSPICAPSRVSLITGRYLSEHGVWDNSCSPLPDCRSLYSDLQELGYHTVNFGKTHFNKPATEFGFDVSHPSPKDGTCAFGITDPAERPGRSVKKLPGNLPLAVSGRHPRPPDQTEAGLLAREVIEHITSLQPGTTGIYLRASFLTPHTPYLPPAPYDDLYDPATLPVPDNFMAPLDGKPTLQRFYAASRGFAHLDEDDFRTIRSSYYGLVTHLDHQVGLIIQALKDADLYERAVIVFTADHGTMTGEHGWVEKWGHFYEPVVRVPLIVHLPGHELAGRTVNALVETIDILPTVLEVVGGQAQSAIGGRSFLSLMQDGRTEHREFVVSEWFAGQIHDVPCTMIRTDRQKLVLYPTDDLESRLPRDHPGRFAEFYADPVITGELYDLEADPGELLNLFDDPQYQPVVAEMRSLRDRWRDSLGPVARWPHQPEMSSGFRYFQMEQGLLSRKISEMVASGGHLVTLEAGK